MADEIIPTEGIRQSQIPVGGLRPIIGGQVSMYGRTPATSPPIRYGALRSDNGVYAGRVPFQPINDSASPVIGAYSPYPTMLFAPRRPDSFAMMMDMMRSMRPNIDYTKMIQDLSKRAAKMPTRRGGRTNTGTPPSKVPPPVMPTEPMYAPYGSFLNMWEHPFDATLPPDMYLQGDPTFRGRLGLDGRSSRSVRPDSIERWGQEQAAQGNVLLAPMPSHTPSNTNNGLLQQPPSNGVTVVPAPDGLTPVQQLPQPQQQWILQPNHSRSLTRNRG